VRDLVVHDDDLVVATHGRSFWIMDDVTTLRQIDTLHPPAAPVFYAPQSAVRVRRDTNTDTPLPPEESVGQNPPDGAIFDYELTRPAANVELQITDGAGRLVRRYASTDLAPQDAPLEIPSYWVAPFTSLATTSGMHRFVWDLHAATPLAAEHEYPISAIEHATPREPLGPLVPPGPYRATLIVDGAREDQTFTVEGDPRVSATAADYARQYDLAMQIAGLMDACGEASASEAAMRAKFSIAPAGTSAAAQAVAADLAALALPATNLAGANERLAALLGSVESADAAPTAAQVAAFATLASDARRALAIFERLREYDLPALK
jgi:hypothetical protein